MATNGQKRSKSVRNGHGRFQFGSSFLVMEVAIETGFVPPKSLTKSLTESLMSELTGEAASELVRRDASSHAVGHTKCR